MIKTFCDACGKEIERDYVSDRLIVELCKNGKSFLAEITICQDSTWNKGHICKGCVKEIVAKGQEKHGFQIACEKL